MSTFYNPAPKIVTGNVSQGRRTALAGIAGLAAGALLPGVARAQERGIVGSQAPELEINNWSGASGEPVTFSIAASRGKWTFLKCFQYWCPGCHSSGFPTLAAVQDAFGAHGDVAIAAIQTVFEGYSTNREDRIPDIRERYDLEIPIGHDAGDPDGEGIARWPSTMRNYRTGGTPWLVLIDPAGNVVFDGFHLDRNRLIDFLAEQIA
ncbi:redoxin domain-containing protein [bacterium]|nr:redoxin domain-containing protein [bacterium]